MAKREMKTVNTEAAVEETIIEEATVEETVEEIVEPVIVYGVVTDCSRLNIRKEAKKDAEIVTVVNAGEKVTIDTDCKNKKFYKITTKDGKGGYCVKEYVSLDK